MAGKTTGADRLVVALSDIEMGSGGVLDDFPHSAWLAELMAAYNRPPFDELAVDFVFNGDTLDLLKTPIDGVYPVVVDEAVALAKLERVLAAHPAFPEGCRRFLEHGKAPRRIHFLIGNHDYELVFEAVQDRIREAIGHDSVTFPGFELDIGELHLEHGSQDDGMFRVDPNAVFVEHDGRPILAQPWGAQALIEVALPMHPMLYDLDRLKPRARVMELLPELRDLVMGAFWQYYTGDWIRGLVGGRPNRGVTWSMVTDLAWRFRTADPDVVAGGRLRKRVTDGPTRCVVYGHLHSAEWWSWADRKVLATGCMRDEWAIDQAGSVVARVPKSYAEVYLRGDRVVRSHLVEVDGPVPAASQAPASVFDVMPRIRPMLDAEVEVRALAKEADAADPNDEKS